jgi:signal transduction histidine kinase
MTAGQGTRGSQTGREPATVLWACPTPVLVCDREGVREANPAAADCFGWDGFTEATLPEPLREAIETPLETALAGEVADDVTCRLADGRSLSVSLAPLGQPRAEAPEDQPEAAVCTVHDVTDRAMHVRTLRAECERLESFADTVVHDLRNLIQVASGSLELGRIHDDGDHLDRAAETLDRMKRMLGDLRDLADGRSEVATETVSLPAILEPVWAAYAPEAATLHVEEPLTVRGDPDQCHQLLENLVRNAVDHAGPTVTVRVGALDNGFYVADDGPGIPPGEREQVFDHGYTTSTTGTGYGLTIVRWIAEAHGWRIALEESQNGGARFEFRGART